jgi:hypothetical protein
MTHHHCWLQDAADVCLQLCLPPAWGLCRRVADQHLQPPAVQRGAWRRLLLKRPEKQEHRCWAEFCVQCTPGDSS